MSLRWKILIVITLTAVMIIGAVYAISELTFMKSFQGVENQNAQQTVERADKALTDDINSLNTLNHDWAAWNDTYNFVQNPDKYQSYATDNPTDVTFASAKLNYIFIIDNSNQLIFGKGFNLETGTDVPIPESLNGQIFNDIFTHHVNVTDNVSGIIMLPEGPLMISADPIITSEGKGPIAGTIIMARYLGSAEISEMSATIQSPIFIVNMNATDIPPDFQVARASLSAQKLTFTHIINTQSIAGYYLVQDIYGKPAVILKATMPRDIFAQSVSTMRYFIFSVLGLAILFGFILIYLLSKLVLTRVSQVSVYASNIRTSGDLSKRLNTTGNDELSQLTQNLNGMVDTLQQSHQELLVKQQAEERLRLTIESVAEGIASTDLEGKITDLNESKVMLHGYSNKAELIGKNALDLVSPKDLSKARENMKVALETGFSRGGEYVMLKKDGRTFIGERSTALLRNAEGGPIGFVISTKDITARKRAEETYSTIVEKSNDAIIIVQDNIIKFVNSKMVEVTGFPLGEIVGKPMTEILSPKYRSVILDRHIRRIHGESLPDKYEAEIISHDGEIIPVEISVSVIQYDGKSATVSIVRDVRERRMAQEQLRRSEEKYSTIVEKGNDGIVILQNGVIRFANSRIQSLSGFSIEETIGKSFVNFVSEQFRPLVIEMYKKRMAGEVVPGRYEIAIATKDGNEIPVEVNANPIDFEGKPADMAIIRDIIERKRAADKLARLNEELRTMNLQLEAKVEERTKQLEIAAVEANSANKAKSEFLASMSHELRTPLNAISGFAQVLQQQYAGQLNEKQAKYIGNILESSKHLLSLISDILDLAKIEAGKDELVFSNINIKELLEGSLVMVKDNATKHGIKLGLQIPADVTGLEIEVDERKVKQIVFNLLSNAVKFTPDGGSITVECIKKEKELIIRISDNGIGLTPEQQKKLFERFYQVSGGITAKTPGTGLGLSLARHMTEMHGGRIWVESGGVGKGSCFSFTLPLSRVSIKENINHVAI